MFKSKLDLLRHFGELGFKVGAEVGVSQGYLSEKMFQLIPGLKLYCVDIWKAYQGNPWMPRSGRAEQYYEITKKRLEPYNAEIMRMSSMDAVRKIPAGSLDFVYIDSNHKYDFVMEDLIHWTRRVRKGGIVAGDDYYHFKRAGVVQAVDDYTKAHGIKFELTNPIPYKIIDRNGFEMPNYYWTV